MKFEIQLTKILLLHIFVEPNFASLKNTEKQCKLALDAIYSKLKKRMKIQKHI